MQSLRHVMGLAPVSHAMMRGTMGLGFVVARRAAARVAVQVRGFSVATNAEELVSQGNDAVSHGQAQKAIECYVDAMAEMGETPGLLYNLGSAYCQAGRITDAMVAFRKSLEHDPEQPDALVNLANLHSTMGDQREAIKLYNRALELRPDDAQCRHNLGLSLSKVGDWGAAVAELKKSRDLDSNMPFEPLKYALIRMVGQGANTSAK